GVSGQGYDPATQPKRPDLSLGETNSESFHITSTRKSVFSKSLPKGQTSTVGRPSKISSCKLTKFGKAVLEVEE
ncbi:MAG: hypothetical protein ABI318_06475, partial [Chthoniobacteraceae bacterium]